ncbi:MAG: hypothetical protein QHH10_08275 [Peptococcaceae bacterium]|jgi:hypothetical protein|nr:hypothetical protein [Peptococcaceae bacterium]MDH7525290.1 hypothetical protein [Peptococcaceae bacterium]
MASQKEIKALITLAGKVDPSLQSALLKATGQTNKLKDTMKKTGSIAGGVFKGVLGAQVVSKVAGALFNAGKQVLQLASDLQEVQNVVDVTFGKDAGQINKWSKEALKAYGLSELEAKRYTGTLGAMLKSSGLADESVLKLSTDMVGLAGDMASFYNLDPEEAFEKIRSGISGETEPLKQLGINMSVANLEAFALSKGITIAYNSMDQASQTMLRYAYLMEVTKDAQGDFQRTQDSFANQQKLLRENYKQLSSQIMQGVIPVVAKGLSLVNNVISRIDGSQAGEKVSNALAIIIEKAKPVVSLVQTLIPLIQKVAPIIGDVAYIIGTVLSKAIEIVVPIIEKLVGFLGPVLDGIGKVTSKVKGLISGGNQNTPALEGFAQGGLAIKPSIFGEAGPEMAIPIKPGDQRSIGLLSKTAQMLGVGVGPQIKIDMPITIHAPGGDPGVIKQAAAQAGEEMEERIIAIMERYFAGKERVSYGY